MRYTFKCQKKIATSTKPEQHCNSRFAVCFIFIILYFTGGKKNWKKLLKDCRTKFPEIKVILLM